MLAEHFDLDDLGTVMEEECKCHSKSSSPWEHFSAWIHCICVVTFDLEIGQAMELIYPPQADLTEQEKINICYLAFPDSNSGCMGDTKFHFRLRSNIRMSQERGGLINAHLEYNESCLATLQISPIFFYGFVYFRQVKDKNLPRGYFQKSVVIISRIPFITLFNEVIGIVAPEFFDHGEPSLEAACHDIDQWPFPVPGLMVTLPIFGTAIQVHIPSQSHKTADCTSPLSSRTKNFSPLSHTILSSVCDVDLFRCFSQLLPHIHLLWELVLVAEPIVVIASHPQTCSDMVQALVSIIAPLNFCADYRPYFTIHDSEFKEYTSQSHLPPSVILGVTNPFFAKTLQHWPHIIRTCDSFQANPKQNKLKKGTNLKMLDSKPGLYTHYRPFLKRDKAILAKVIKGIQTKRPGEVQTAILKRHLLELTQSFMIPLERYMASCMPLQKNISPYKAAPVPRPFNPDDFLATLDTAGPNLTSGVKGDWPGLYRRFFRSPNFSGWYNARYSHLSKKLRALQLEALSDADLTEWVRDKKEVEVVDMVLTIRNKLQRTDLPLSSQKRDQLRSRMNDMICTLPEDLKAVLKTS